MNKYQIVFLIFVFLPPVLSIVLDITTMNIKKLRWIKFYDSVLPIYLLSWLILAITLIYIILGEGL